MSLDAAVEAIKLLKETNARLALALEALRNASVKAEQLRIGTYMRLNERCDDNDELWDLFGMAQELENMLHKALED